MKEYDKGLSYLLEVEKAEPENLEIQAKIGRCFLDLKNFEQALKYFFKVEYLAPSNIKVLRPIAWCYFMMGKFENAIKFIDKVIKIEGNSHDFINLGHIQWCMGNITKASELYLKSIHFKDNTYQLFLEEFNEDLEYLKLFNLKEEEIFFMHDHLKYSTKD
jgi:tetratricopeptide (TPR) repeat protein